MADRVDAIVSLSKRRDSCFPVGDLRRGPLRDGTTVPGVELKENIRRAWWSAIVRQRDDIVGLDSSVILAPEVWKASGHLEAFVDPLVECTSCHKAIP